MFKKKELVAKIDSIINNGNLNEQNKKELIEVKIRIEKSNMLSEAMNHLIVCFIRIVGKDFDLFN